MSNIFARCSINIIKLCTILFPMHCIYMKWSKVMSNPIPPQGQGPVFFLTATLRPETFYGIVNAWVLPEGQYGAFRGMNNEIYIMTQKSALNLSYQDRMPVTGQPECLLNLNGQDLIGTPLKVTFAALPFCTVSAQACLPIG